MRAAVLRGRTLEARARAIRFGRAIAGWRLTEDVTIAQAAHLLGVTAPRLRDMEEGEVDPATVSPATAVRILRVTALPADVLGLDEPGDEAGAVTSPAPGTPPAATGGDAVAGVAASSPFVDTRPWRVGLGANGAGGWMVTVRADATLSPEQAVELAYELFKEAALARG